MKRILLQIMLILLFINNGMAQKKIVVKNPLKFERTEIIAVPFAEFTRHFGVDSVFSVKDEAGNLLVVQLEKLGLAKPQNVLIQVNLKAGEIKNLIVLSDASPKFEVNTYARKVPERFDDFAWENDVVAFRLYGKALEGKKDDAKGMDYWAKRTNHLVINKWYKSGDYHHDYGEGLDYYSVGETLGLGDVAIFGNNKIQYTKHYRNDEILDQGPLRTTFKLSFDEEDINGEQISLTKTISLDAGANFNSISLELKNKNANQTEIVVGIAKRKENNPEYKVNNNWPSISYFEPEINNSGRVGAAVILPKTKATAIVDRADQFLLKTKIKNSQKFKYYNGAAWNRAGKISSAQDWYNMVSKFEERLKAPFKFELK